MSSIAEQLLAGLTEDQIEAYSADMATEEHIVINADRTITVPDELRRIAVQYDHDVETVIFDCPRYWDEHDMSQMKIYINYVRSDRVVGMYWAQNVVVDDTDENIMHFTWTVSRNVTEVEGKLAFLVCVKNTDDAGDEVNHWNSELCEDMYVSEGLECEEIVLEPYPDVITQLLLRMDYVEEIATPETMQNYVNDYLDKNPETPETIKNYLYGYMSTNYPTTEDAMMEYIDMYLEKHPPLFVIGSEKPGVDCVWFNTGSEQAVTNTVVKLTAEAEEGNMYAEVEGEDKPVYDFDIL